jgi:cytochrome bd ubiquinol oxidase subunit I
VDALILARVQFAANMTFHILFPTISIALGWILLFFRVRWLLTHDEAWLVAYRFWTKVFALSFALGVVSGITMSFQFGTNWPGFMLRVGNVAGPLLGYEVLTAFFLEATFLGVMLFGHQRVSERTHLIATFLVAFGTTMSAFWILSLNSWLQTPAGYTVVDGQFHVASWLQLVFNPSFPYRLAHMGLASGLTVAFLISGLSAWQQLRGAATRATPRVLRLGLTLAALLIPLQIAVGDAHGLNTLEYQPQKIAAIEGVWHTERGAPLLLFAWPDPAHHANRAEIGIPRGASLILRHAPDAEIRGLDQFTDAQPPVAPLFFGFRVMVGTGLLMLATSWGAWLAYRRCGWRAAELPRPLLGWLALMSYSGWIATVAGWYVTEIGRQPFIVYGQLRTADVASDVASPLIASTLAMYLIVYVSLIGAFVGVLRHMAGKGEEHPAAAERPHGGAALDGAA